MIYKEINNNKAHTIILLHGLMGVANRDFNFILPYLSEKFNVILVCFSGFGKEKKNFRDQVSIEQIINELYCLIIEKELKNTYLFGYCFGGHIALKFAIDYPFLIKGVFSYGTKVFWNEDDTKKSQSVYDLDRIKCENPKWYSCLKKDHDINLQQVSKLSKALSKESANLFYKYYEELKEMPVKCTFIYGEFDDLASPNEMSILKSLNNKNFIYYTISKADHNTFFIDAEKILNILTSHLEKTSFCKINWD